MKASNRRDNDPRAPGMKHSKEQEKSDPNYRGTQLHRDRPSESRESGVLPEGREYYTMLTGRDIEIPRDGPDGEQPRSIPRNERNPWFLPQEGFTGPQYEQAREARNEVLANREKRRADRLKAALATTSAHIKSNLTSSTDIKMAARQVGIDALSWLDKRKQERWASQQIKKNSSLSKLCPGGKGWKRVEGGYVCEVDTHATTDELLAEGKHGFYLSADRDLSKYDIHRTSIGGISFYGPFYVMPDFRIYAADMAADRALYRGVGSG